MIGAFQVASQEERDAMTPDEMRGYLKRRKSANKASSRAKAATAATAATAAAAALAGLAAGAQDEG